MGSKRINNLIKNHITFEKEIDETIKIFKNVLSNPDLTSAEKGMIAEGILLKSCALWEKFLEKEIVTLVSFDTTNLINEVKLPQNTKLNLRLIKAILFSNCFRDFHDIDRSKNFFNTFIVSKHNPFIKIPKDLIDNAAFTYKIRNYLAHNSEYAKNQLLNHLRKNFYYTNFIEPSKFLVKGNGKNLTQLVHNFSLLSASMRKNLK